jgi:hypothetical protein
MIITKTNPTTSFVAIKSHHTLEKGEMYLVKATGLPYLSSGVPICIGEKVPKSRIFYFH